MKTVGGQLFELFVLALPVAAIARTVVFEEIFRELREWCTCQSKTCKRVVSRKFFYLFTCEFCFSYWVSAAVVATTGFRLLYDSFLGYLVGLLSLVFVSNFYMNLYARLRVDVASEKKSIEVKQAQADAVKRGLSVPTLFPPDGRD
jgi:hypothetical protein